MASVPNTICQANLMLSDRVISKATRDHRRVNEADILFQGSLSSQDRSLTHPFSGTLKVEEWAFAFSRPKRTSPITGERVSEKNL